MGDTKKQALQLFEAAKIRAPHLAHEFVEGRKWRFSFAWPEHKIGVDILPDTGEEAPRPERLLEAALEGWMVLQIPERFVRNGKIIHYVARALRVKTTTDVVDGR